MPHDFDMDRPEHRVHHIRMPQGHAHLDEKLDKGMRSPIVSQLPAENGLEAPELDQNQEVEDGAV